MYALRNLKVKILSLDNFPEIGEIEESGSTLLENSLIKSREVQRITGIPAIADDTGLEVELLNGANNSPRYGVIEGVTSAGGLLIKDQNGVLFESFSGSIRLIDGSLRRSVDEQSEN